MTIALVPATFCLCYVMKSSKHDAKVHERALSSLCFVIFIVALEAILPAAAYVTVLFPCVLYVFFLCYQNVRRPCKIQQKN